MDLATAYLPLVANPQHGVSAPVPAIIIAIVVILTVGVALAVTRGRRGR